MLGAAKGIGHLAGSALEGIARQPEAGGRIGTNMIIAAALIEGFTFFALVICYQLIAKVGPTVNTIVPVSGGVRRAANPPDAFCGPRGRAVHEGLEMLRRLALGLTILGGAGAAAVAVGIRRGAWH